VVKWVGRGFKKKYRAGLQTKRRKFATEGRPWEWSSPFVLLAGSKQCLLLASPILIDAFAHVKQQWLEFGTPVHINDAWL